MRNFRRRWRASGPVAHICRAHRKPQTSVRLTPHIRMYFPLGSGMPAILHILKSFDSFVYTFSRSSSWLKMMISPLADSSPFKLARWRTPQPPQLEAQLLSSTVSPLSSSKYSLAPNQNTFNFLLVDDNEINLRIFRRVLKKLFPKSTIDTIQDSAQVDPTTLLLYQIVFLDIEMPIVTGVDIANEVRLRAALDNIGLIAVTTKSTSADLKMYEACGFDLTIPKPVHVGYSGILRDIENVLKLRCDAEIYDQIMSCAHELTLDSDTPSAS